ncbi:MULTISPECIES: CoA transferase [unclassified Solwaraspora]|uniref:CoA transferase n=1 Tax=unclassified Solwaraspora TaxID=2627926 RepID=UPI00248CCBE0|nr:MULTISPECIES: CoA transferase [unclassified Solwaraspora]WBB98906.1 CoA transferase [Solwaraspora sp. WMMA2059]WBC22541.1 CoA transferase [Solwaraspora sp. WMMA2080]WJK35405.1 CoA transferase [Solwaraspora sp. WMMA2065]
MTVDAEGTRTVVGPQGVPVPAGPLAGHRLAGAGGTAAHRVLARHLVELGADRVSDAGPLRLIGPDEAQLPIELDWTEPADPAGGAGRPAELDEVTAQARYGLMAVHGRARGGPARISLDYVGTAAAVVAGQGVLAALLAGLRGGPAPESVRVPVAGAALLTVSQYLAAGSADDPEYVEAPTAAGSPPPFVCADGVWVELETLDPAPWHQLWTGLGVEPSVAARAWRAFVLRYATATAPLPAQLHAAVAAVPLARLQELAGAAGVAVQPVRGHADRSRDNYLPGADTPPWTIAAGPQRRAVGVDSGGAAGGTGGGPLTGLRVVEAGRRIQGPLAGQVLRLLGAEVIRIEPAGGDPLRGMPPMVGDCSARFLALNRGKRIVEADLRSPDGRATVRELATSADAFLHNWAPGKAARLGLDAGDLWAANPRLVYTYASGWGDARGSDPPPGTDFMVQAYAGLGAQLRPAGEPPAGSLMTMLDVLGGLVAAQGVLAGLVAGHRDGRGQRVDSSLLSAAGVLQGPVLRGEQPAHPRGGPLDGPLPAAGGHLAVPEGTTATSLARITGGAGLAGALDRLAELPVADAVGQLRAGGVAAVPVCPEPGLLAADPTLAALLDIDGCAFVTPPWRFFR